MHGDAHFHCFDIADNEPVIAAVSGGGDSMALLHRARARFTHLQAVTVDHGLRADSADEARAVGALAQGLGCPHRTVALHPETLRRPGGIQERARAGRYALLAQAARAHGARCVLTGHTLDDCLETVLMRDARTGQARSREDDAPGLASIPPATLHDGVWFVRPLLALRRSQLRADLASRHWEWIEDPSNCDERFERVRVRGHLAGLDDCDVTRLADRMRKRRADRYRTAADAAHLVGEPDWLAVGDWPEAMNVKAPVAGDDALARRAWMAAVGWLLRRLSGRPHGLDALSLQHVHDLASAGRNGAAYTVCGLVLRKDASGLTVRHDPRHGHGDQPFTPDLVTDFDWFLEQALHSRLGRHLPDRVTLCDPLA